MNATVRQLFERHEARRRFLPQIGIEVKRLPSREKIAEAMQYHRMLFPEKQRLERQLRYDWLMRSIEEKRRFGIDTSDDETVAAILSVPTHHASVPAWCIYNSAMATTASPVKQPTGTAIRTMMQLKAATGIIGRIFEWGCSFDGSAAATPGQIELVETGQVGATSLSTAYATTDIMPFGDPNQTLNTSGTSGVPFNLGASASGFSTAGVTEGSTTSTRPGDTQLLPPTAPYVKQLPLGREFPFGYWGGNANYLRVRATFGTTVNMTSYVLCEI